MGETEEQRQLKQKEREKQLNEEFEDMQKKLSEELQEQMEDSYQQKIEEAHRRSKQIRENYRTAEWSQIRLQENNNETKIQSEQMTCWRCGEIGHRKKECWKTLFCIHCGKQGHNASR